ncbi:MAG: SDR family NAD(P)-dependent oxidoreductase [Phycisphaerales bacterium]|nr:SDR family NAD(P)-dependent oxidoreductase [Phycisphaerales bacterium]
MAGSFDGRHVVVTGGCGALGSAVASLLLAQGAVVHIPALDAREADSSPLRGRANVDIAPNVNLTDEGQVESFYTELPALWASIHVAGGFAMAPIASTSLADFHRQIDMNLVTCFLCCREAVKKMRAGRAADAGRGRIVNVAAKPALIPVGGMSAYSCAKSGVAALTLALAEELRDEGVWVNAVVPSIMDTRANRRAMPDADHEKWPKIDEVAQTIAFLASSENRATRAALVPVYGRS